MKKLINIKYALKAVINKPIFTVILIIQLTASMYFLYNSILFTDKSLTNINKVSSLFDETKLSSIELVDELEALFTVKFKESDIINRLDKFDKFLTTSEKFDCIRFNNNSILVEDFDNIDKFRIKGNTASKQVENITFNRLYSLKGNAEFFNHFKFQIIEGRSFNKDDFNSVDIIPVILGYNFAEKFKIGDTLQLYNEYERKVKILKVIGFLSKDSRFFQKTFSPEGLYNLDNYVLSPTYDIANCSIDKNDSNYISVIRNIYLNNILDTLLISDINPRDLQNMLQEKSNSLNLYNVKINSAKDLLDSYKAMYDTQRNFMLVLFFIVLFFTSINMITTLTSYIRNKQKEFCVHLMYGATKLDIMKRMFFEILILISISLIFMMFVNYILNGNSIALFWSTEAFIKLLILSLVMVLLLSIIPLKKLININLNDILKED